ncbi:hypothetical protein DFS33DRAFT_1373500 [Desarmillaria ectypa]|nr:hypothetical protein DFS33DRAFT_1373500 [Desarmillaria ectypa]
MAGGTIGDSPLSAHLAPPELPDGCAGLVQVFSIAVFASQGGLMYTFEISGAMHSVISDPGKKGWLVAILELGAWILDWSTVVFCVGVIVQTAAKEPSSIYGGRFVTGLGIGSTSMAVSFYNAELAPPEVRGSLVALQLAPAIILGCGIIFMPFSPRWLVNQGRDDDALTVLSNLRVLPKEDDLVPSSSCYEIKAQYLFEKEISEAKFPQYQDPYLSLILDRSGTMFFQQWTVCPSVFKSLGLTGNTLSLLVTGVVGIITFLGTIPAVLFIDQLGRKPVLVSGAFLMATCHFVIAILTNIFHNSWERCGDCSAGWVACAFVWIFASGFSYGWGPCSWIIISEMFPLSVRSKSLSIAVSSNWMNHFIIGQVMPSMLQRIGYGTFVFFGIFSFLGGRLIMFLVPETKGVSLEEMEVLFGNITNLASEDLRRIEDVHKRLGLIVGNIDEKHDEEAGKVSYDENAGEN